MDATVKKPQLLCATIYSVLIFLGSISYGNAGNVLTSDEIRALITNKTVSVTLSADDSQWSQYFAEDGTSLRHPSGEKSTWSIENGKHCNTAAKLLCAAIQRNDDGTFSRQKPNGDTAATWTNIVDGKQF